MVNRYKLQEINGIYHITIELTVGEVLLIDEFKRKQAEEHHDFLADMLNAIREGTDGG